MRQTVSLPGRLHNFFDFCNVLQRRHTTLLHKRSGVPGFPQTFSWSFLMPAIIDWHVTCRNLLPSCDCRRGKDWGPLVDLLCTFYGNKNLFHPLKLIWRQTVSLPGRLHNFFDFCSVERQHYQKRRTDAAESRADASCE